MPKVKKVSYTIDNVTHEANINVASKSGLFTLVLHVLHTHAMGFPHQRGCRVGNTYTSTTLQEIEKDFYIDYTEYKNSKTIVTLFIGIGLKVGGSCKLLPNGDYVPKKYQQDRSWREYSGLEISYTVFVEEDINGIKNNFKAIKSTEQRTINTKDIPNNNEYVYANNYASLSEFNAIIPYTTEAMLLLNNIENGLTTLANKLYSLVSQAEETKILDTTNIKLLGN
jgi:hypothetical protein